MKNYSKFEITSGKITTGDPCYCPDTIKRCGLYKALAKKGEWVYTKINEDGRVGTLMCWHESLGPNLEANNYRWADSNIEICVDSGQAGVFDSSIYTKKGEPIKYGDLTTFYGRACQANDDDESVDGKGVCVSSGYGDGGYPLYVIKEKNDKEKEIIVAVKIVFIDTEEDEHYCEHCGR